MIPSPELGDLWDGPRFCCLWVPGELVGENTELGNIACDGSLCSSVKAVTALLTDASPHLRRNSTLVFNVIFDVCGSVIET